MSARYGQMAHVSVEIELLFENAVVEWVRDTVKKS